MRFAGFAGVALLYFAITCALQHAAKGELLPKLDRAMPRLADITSWYPVFDFDGDSCFPSAGFSRQGKMNHGLNPSGSVTGMCRDAKFMDTSNTYHRYACINARNSTYCGHSFALYFLKDQQTSHGGGHRHDREHVILWIKDGGGPGYVSYSDGGEDMTMEGVNSLFNSANEQNGHRKFVYHKKGTGLHCFRPAKSYEVAENSCKAFVTPTIASWFTMAGDGLTNEQLRAKMNSEDKIAHSEFPHADSRFLSILNKHKPDAFPAFSEDSVANSQ